MTLHTRTHGVQHSRSFTFYLIVFKKRRWNNKRRPGTQHAQPQPREDKHARGGHSPHKHHFRFSSLLTERRTCHRLRWEGSLLYKLAFSSRNMVGHNAVLVNSDKYTNFGFWTYVSFINRALTPDLRLDFAVTTNLFIHLYLSVLWSLVVKWLVNPYSSLPHSLSLRWYFLEITFRKFKSSLKHCYYLDWKTPRCDKIF